MSSAADQDFEFYGEVLEKLPRKEGYPSVGGLEGSKARNRERQNEGISYHLYKLSHEDKTIETPLGFVQFGVMPSRGYDEGPLSKDTGKYIEGLEAVHHPIIQTWLNLELTRQINPEDGLEKKNIERIENRGVAQILPIFTQETTEEHRKGAVEACFAFVCELASLKELLPAEFISKDRTLPYVAMGLFHPDDSNISYFSQNGFKIDENPGFGWFYPKVTEEAFIPQPRTMVTRFVETRE